MSQANLNDEELDSTKIAKLKQLLIEFQDLAAISGAPSPKIIDTYSVLRLITHFEKIVQRQGARNRRLILRLERLAKERAAPVSKYTEELEKLEKLFSKFNINS
jgi:hypothetical protein